MNWSVIVALATALLTCRGQARESAGCLGSGMANCVPPPACTRLQYTCTDGNDMPRAFMIERAEQRPPGQHGDAAVGDFVLENGKITVVIDSPGRVCVSGTCSAVTDHPHQLAPTGGTIVDMATRGGADHINQILTVTGILPRDAAHYVSAEMLNDETSARIVVRGFLDGVDNVQIVTTYELRQCDPGVRIRTEVYNGGRQVWTQFLADGYWWGDRGLTPFVPLVGQGYKHPPLDLLEIDRSFRTFPWMAASSHVGPHAGYAVVACERETLQGFNNAFISGAGIPRAVVRPGDGLAFERMIMVQSGPGLGPAQTLALDARRQLFNEAVSEYTGRLVSETGAPIGGDERRASILFYEAGATVADDVDQITPWSEVVPDANGNFKVTLPAGRRFRYRIHQLGRAMGAGVDLGTTLALGDIRGSLPPRLELNVVAAETGMPMSAEIILTPAGDTTAAQVDGSVYGLFGEGCAPYLGFPHGGSPACNHALSFDGSLAMDVPRGTYWVYATAGPASTIDRQMVTLPREPGATPITLRLRRLTGIYPAGSLSGDFHVHSGQSYDITFPDRERVMTFATAGVDVIAATDHDVCASFTNAVTELGLTGRFHIMTGVESTGQIPFLVPPGGTFPRVMGHYIFWPLQYDARLPRNGAPWDELMEPGQLFDTMQAAMTERGVIQLNHPTADSIVGRDLGYLRVVEVYPRTQLPTTDDGTAPGLLFRNPVNSAGVASRHRNIDWDAQEAMQGAKVLQNLQYRAAWHSLLSQNILRAGTANSDSHSLKEEQLGYPRNIVLGNHSLATFDEVAFNAAVRDGRMVGTNGPMIEASIMGADGQRHSPSLTLFAPAPDATLEIEVRAAPWIPVTEIRIVVNNRVARTIPATSTPADPLGTDGIVRYRGSLPIADFLRRDGTWIDGWIIVEAGLPLVASADTDDDGLLDAIDANGDGTAATGEVELVRATPADPRFHIDTISAGAWPTAFTNPFIVNADGNQTWNAPGI